jgi:glycosyltransferase involved in cell wall biosynthesis
MKKKILHIVGGNFSNGAFQGAKILHNELINQGIDSKILNDVFQYQVEKDANIISINDNFFIRIKSKIFILIEKFLKSVFLHSPRETFTLGILGNDITQTNIYKQADIIHIHWLSQGFIKLSSLKKIKKPIIWTMRDMWAFTGGSHYKMDFKKYEKSFLSKMIRNYKKKIYENKIQFVAVSNWIKKEALNSSILKDANIIKIDNNINTKDFKKLDQEKAKSILKISTKKQIILYGAQNPQSPRKGWKIFIESLRKIDRSNFFLIIFGNFWSEKIIDEIGIDYKSMGFIEEKSLLNTVYCSADFFVASSIEDAWPKTFAEAMYCGIPVVCFKNTSISEIVDHKKNGFIADHFNSESLREGIEWLSEAILKGVINSKDVTKKASKYNPESTAKKYLELYKRIAK